MREVPFETRTQDFVSGTFDVVLDALELKATLVRVFIETRRAFCRV